MSVVTRTCLGLGCSKPVDQTKGRRQRDTCSDACRQRLCQQRKRERAQARCRALWQGWPDPLRACLELILTRSGPALAAQTARTINDVCCPPGIMLKGTVDELVR
ncbi:MAG TPA: hypothetical protein VKT82_15635 [Ktedonobacterales bacterium]|nr:hypothetical protein [Ktedonobacterales bacterium]